MMEKSMTRILSLLLLCALPIGAYAATAATPARSTAAATAAPTAPAAANATATRSDEDKLLFAIGQLLSRSLYSFDFNEHEKQVVQAGLANGLRNPKAASGADSFMSKIQALQSERAGKAMVKTKATARRIATSLPAARTRSRPPAAS